MRSPEGPASQVALTTPRPLTPKRELPGAWPKFDSLAAMARYTSAGIPVCASWARAKGVIRLKKSARTSPVGVGAGAGIGAGGRAPVWYAGAWGGAGAAAALIAPWSR